MPTPFMPTDVATLGTYRGFDIGWSWNRPPLIHPCWRIPAEGKWNIGHVLADNVVEAARIARECIDYQYRVEAWETEHGRKYDRWDIVLPSND